MRRVGKHWTPRKPTIALRASRIRHQPLLVREPEKKAQPPSPEREMWGGIAGVLLFSAAIAAAIVGISAVTIIIYASNQPEPRPGHFGHCYNENGPNCVLDGGTIYVAGQRIEIAGMVAPSIQDPRCPEERSRGIDAAMRLADLLNSGHVTVGGTFRDPYGRAVRKVQVNDEDVGEAMISAGLARKAGEAENYCTSA
jgi:endonuclease YncB( thermonuclease family)